MGSRFVAAVMIAFLPCVTFGQIAEVMDQGEMTCLLASYIYTLMMPALCSHGSWDPSTEHCYLVEAPYDYEDVVSHIFCSCCSLCQEFRELKRRGLNPALGWNGILAQQSGTGNGPQVVPPSQTMNM